ncbi:MAG: DNA internalization-related competence protein ComEC/Rec2 [Coriobacteriales bacterium]|nr:DNA internalization-related competence protein ComEC/Rec2 [Coriobacteriales bacterium]
MTESARGVADERSQALLKAPRPMLPLLLGPLIAIWAGISLAAYASWRDKQSTAWWLLGIMLCLCAGVWFICLRQQQNQHNQQNQRPQQVLLLTLVLGLGLAWGLLHWQRIDTLCSYLAESAPSELCCRVLSDPQYGNHSAQSIVLAELPNGQSCRLRLFWPKDDDVPAYGSMVTVSGSYKALQDYQDFLYQQDIVGSFTVRSIVNVGFPGDLLGRIAEFRQSNYQKLTASSDSSGYLLAGVLLGCSSQLNQTWTGEAFRITGLSHLVAVSGSHLAVIASLVAWVLQKLGFKTSVEIALLILFISFYVLLTALQPSALRSAGMMAIVQSARLFGRRSHAPSALSATACLMIILEPAMAFSLGFWLSVFAVFGMAVYLPLTRSWLTAAADTLKKRLKIWLTSQQRLSQLQHAFTHQRLFKRSLKQIKQLVVEPSALSLTAQACTLPLTAPVFACISLIALPANLVVTPLVTLMLSLGLPVLVIGWLVPPVLDLVLGLLHSLSSLICQLAEALASLPWALAPIDVQQWFCLLVFAVLAALVYKHWPLPSKAGWQTLAKTGLAVLLLFAVLVLRPQPPELVMLDIGQGDAILVREGNNAVLIDSGPSIQSLRRALSRNSVNSLDALLLSHLDSDHCGGMVALMGVVQPNNIYLASGLLTNQADDQVIVTASQLIGAAAVLELQAGDVLIISEHLQLTVLLPTQPVMNGDNPDSLVLSLNYDTEADGQVDLRVLLTGDAESDVLRQISREYPELRFTVLKVAHHGSRQAVSANLLELWQTEVALISVGAGNQFGHPTPETLDTLQAADILILRTDELGDIRLRFSPRGLIISYSDNYPFWSF